jgi:predicted adenylyl cyclase CyaB
MTDSSHTPVAPRTNIELKARLASLETAREVASRLATERLEDQLQIDTYFHCKQGRLKLREIDRERAELIWYERPDQSEPKASNYCLVPVDDPAAAKQALVAALGVRQVVEKHREIYLYHNVRIHLDRVVNLGEFLEFEAVLGPDVSADEGNAQVAYLREQFGIASSDLATGSYADLI